MSSLPPSKVLNLREIEELAKSVLSPTAWAYYRSTGDDENSYRENAASYKRFWFRPRILTNVSTVDMSTKILSFPTSLPIFMCPVALAGLGHPDGEKNLVRAAGKENILYCMSINSSCPVDEVVSAKVPEQTLFFQLYIDRDRAASEALIKRVEKAGFKAIILTVDAAVPGNRELDQRTKLDGIAGPTEGESNDKGRGVSYAISGYQDPSVCWQDIKWLAKLTKLPIIIKGIGCVEDAELAFQCGVQAIFISNHGGRQLDFTPAAMTVLHEIYQKKPNLLKEHEVYIDGGVTRGTDVLKALCLGARAVGLGRAFLYANGIWGEEGCRRVVKIMREEIERGMQLLGVTCVDQLRPEYIRSYWRWRRMGFPIERLLRSGRCYKRYQRVCQMAQIWNVR